MNYIFFVQVSQVLFKTLANYSKTTSLDITCQLKSKSLITHLLPTNPERRRGATITESSHQGASASPFLAGISGVLSSSVLGVAWFKTAVPPVPFQYILQMDDKKLIPRPKYRNDLPLPRSPQLAPGERNTISSVYPLFCRPAIIDLSAPALRFDVAITQKAYR